MARSVSPTDSVVNSKVEMNVFFAVMSFSFLFFACGVAIAQRPAVQAPHLLDERKKAAEAMQPRWQPLKEMPTLPFLPTYSGKATVSFARVKELQNKRLSYIVSFGAVEAPREIADWYEGALNANKWSVKRANNMINASRGENNSCTISISPSIQSNFRSQTTLTYVCDK